MKRLKGKALNFLTDWCEPKDFQQMIDKSFSWVSKKWIKAIVRFLGKKGKKVIKVLDLGCGPGGVTILLAKELKEQGFNAEVVGLDIQKKAIELATDNLAKEDRNSIAFHVGDATKLYFENNEFDLIIATALFPFLGKEKLIQVFNESYRVLKPEGIFYFICPNRNHINLLGAYLITGKIKKYEIDAVRHCYTPKETLEIISKTPLWNDNNTKVRKAWLGLMVETFGTINKTS